MNILQLSIKFPYPPYDGGALAALNMIRGFHHLGHTITVLSMNTSKHYADIATLPDSVKSLAKFYAVPVNTNIRPVAIIRNLLFSKAPYNAERFIHKDYIKKLCQILDQKKFDIIQLEGLFLMPYISCIKKHSQAKIVLRAHNVESEIWQRKVQREKNPVKKFYTFILAQRMRRMERNAINQYDLLVPITARDASFFDYYGNIKPMHIAPFGVFPDDYTAPSGQESLSIAYIGALDWLPNRDGLQWFLQHVWPSILTMHPNVTFHIAGRNAPVPFVKKLQQQPGVIFHGEVEDSRKYLEDKKILVIPLFAGSGMRVKIIEGLALGKVVVSTPIGAEGIPATPEKELFLAETSIDFIRHLDLLISNESIRKSVSLSARRFVREKFDNFVICQSLIDFYTQNLQ